MELNEPALLDLAHAVADGTAIDWDLAESSAQTDEERNVVRQLQSLAGVGLAARSLVQSWGPLEIRGEVGSGMFGTVYRAWDARLEREVALKLLHAGQPLASTVIAEGRLLAQIRHPNVITVFGADALDGRAGIWMEFVTGRTLKEIVIAQGPFGPQEAALIGRDLCRALTAVHKLGFLHRDVKAQNVMREAGGRTVLMDFGAGETVTAGGEAAALRGTPVYLAPELLEGARPSVQSDLYSLGVLLYFLVSGTFPVTGTSIADLRERHATGRRALLRDLRPGLPPAFVQVVDACLDPDPTGRPASAGALEARLERALGLPGDPDTESATTRPSKGVRRQLTGRRLALTAVMVFAIAAAGWAIRNRWAGTHAPAGSWDSVLILPFSSQTAHSESEYFSDGITQGVVAHLTRLSDLRIIAGASARRYRAGETSAEAFAKKLGAATLLSGSVKRVDNRIQVASKLTDADTGEKLWSEAFERDVEDVFAMQVEVSRKIALALKGRLTELEAKRLAVARGRDFEAFEWYMKGRHDWALRTEESLNRSVEYYERAIRKDPRFALAYAGLADAYVTLGSYGFRARADANRRADEAARKAVSLNSGLGEAHLSLAYVQKNRFEWKQAKASFSHALALNPGSAQAHHWYSIYLTHVGDFNEATVEIEKARRLDPLSVGANLQLASLLLMKRRPGDAISQWQATLQMDGGFVNAYRGMTSAYTQLKVYDLAHKAAAEAASRVKLGAEDQELMADLGYLLAVSGDWQKARNLARDLATRYNGAHEAVAGSIAAIYAGLGDVDAAFDWLTRARDHRDPELLYLQVDPKWDPLRSDRRFDQILASLGFEMRQK